MYMHVHVYMHEIVHMHKVVYMRAYHTNTSKSTTTMNQVLEGRTSCAGDDGRATLRTVQFRKWP